MERDLAPPQLRSAGLSSVHRAGVRFRITGLVRRFLMGCVTRESSSPKLQGEQKSLHSLKVFCSLEDDFEAETARSSPLASKTLPQPPAILKGGSISP